MNVAVNLPRAVRSEFESRAWALRLKLWTQERIAAELGVSQATVSRMLARVERRVLAKLEKQVARTKARQTLQLEHAADEAMQAWERSKVPARKVKQRAAGGVVVEEELTVEDSAGNPAFLAAARSMLADVRRIWGMEADAGGAPSSEDETMDPAAAKAALRASVEAPEPP